MLSGAEVLGRVRRAVASSEMVRELKRYRPAPTRNLTDWEIRALEAQGCRAQDWGRIRAAAYFDPARVRGCDFEGDVTLGVFRGEIRIAPGVNFKTGVYDSVVANSVIEDDALVLRAGLLANYRVGRGALLRDCGTVSTSRGATFGNGTALPVGVETGGREVAVYADLTIQVAERVAKRRGEKAFLAEYARQVARFVEAIRSEAGVIAQGASVTEASRVIDAFIGPHAVVDNPTAVENTTIMSAEGEAATVSDGAYVRDSIIQWGCEVTSMGVVERSVLTEHSHVAKHGKVIDSIIGPNTGVAEGEITACLVGPFVGFHHQAMLIAALWPEGKGNVAYGANVGSNHTSRAPDQEIWPGEGVFFGLGCNIKFPSNFADSPYTIVSAGVTTLPQKLMMPFSLINLPAVSVEMISPSFNEIVPGWSLYGNIFALRRNEGKYKKRNKATRSTFVFDILRPDTVELMRRARTMLSRVKTVKKYYVSEDIPGIGKNYMTEESRLRGIEAYTFYIRYYALLGLMRKLQERLGAGKSAARLLGARSSDGVWEHQRRIIRAELRNPSPADCLAMLGRMQDEVAEQTEESKAKDDRRGAAIIDDYAEAHSPAAEDSFVKETWDQTRRLRKEIKALLRRLGA